MDMTEKYSIYRVVRYAGKQRIRSIEPVGYVFARHEPHALLQAIRRWPQYVEADQPQGSFRARRTLIDKGPLGYVPVPFVDRSPNRHPRGLS
jgi:hypothetical protein